MFCTQTHMHFCTLQMGEIMHAHGRGVETYTLNGVMAYYVQISLVQAKM